MPIDFTGMQFPSTEDAVRSEAASQGVNPDLATRVARQESGLKQQRAGTTTTSSKGALGVMQLMPPTASDLGVNPHVESENIRGGVSYLRQMLDRYNGDQAKALAAYNAGPGRVDSGKELPDETKQYVASVMDELQPTDFSGMQFSGSQPEPRRKGPLEKDNRPGFMTRSMVETATGQSLAQGYDKLLEKLKPIVPESMRGKYLTEMASEISKAGPEMADFLTSPAGIGLVAAHFFPASAPFAAAADLALGGYTALQSIPDVIDAVRNFDDPHKVGRAIVGVGGAYLGLKGGGRVASAMREMPAGLKAGLPMAKAYVEAFKKTEPPPPVPAGKELRARLDAAAPEDRPAIIREAEQPTSLAAAAEKMLYQSKVPTPLGEKFVPGLRGFVNLIVPRVKKPPLLDLAQDFVDERAASLSIENNRVRRVTDWIKRNVPEDEQNIRKLGYAMEGDIPTNELSPQGQQALEMLRQLNRERETMLREAYGDDLSLMNTDSYIRHYWDFGNVDAKNKYFVASKLMRDPSLRARQISSLKLGMTPVEEGGYGLTPTFENITDVVRRRHTEAVRAIENQKFANTLADYGLILSPDKALAAGASNWVRATDSPALKRATYGGTTQSGDVIMKYDPPMVHPDIQMAVNAIFKEPLRGPTWSALDQLRSFSKQIAVGFSLFHNNALSEVAQGQAAGLGNIPRAVKALAWPIDPEFIKGVRNSIWEVRGKVAPEAPPDVRLRPEVIEPWLKANLSMESAENEAATISAAMNLWKNANPILKAVGTPVRALGKVQYVLNKALFDYYLPGQMLHSAEGIFTREMNRLGPNPHPGEVFQLRREISDHVNRAFGADNLERLLISSRGRQALAFTLFAPMWTLSNLRVLGKGFETTTGSRITGRYAAGAALTYFLTAELANHAFSSYWNMEDKNGKKGGHWTWDNPGNPVKIGDKYVPGLTDNSANIAFGHNPDGSQRYIRLGKGFREPFLWMTAPLETLGSKLSVPLRSLMVWATGNEPGTYYPAIDTDLPREGQRQQLAFRTIEPFTPFSASDLFQRAAHKYSPEVFREPAVTSQLWGLPARKGASFYRSVEDLRDAMEAGRTDLAIQIAKNAALNKIPPKRLIKELQKRKMKERRTAFGIPQLAEPAEETSIDHPDATERPPVDYRGMQF